MKKLIIATLLMAGFNALADIAQCTQTLQNMADVTNDYSWALKLCRTSSPGSTQYTEASQIARESEALFPSLLNNCYQVCGGDANSLAFCNGSLSGACQPHSLDPHATKLTVFGTGPF